jgi:hypothetical protein
VRQVAQQFAAGFLLRADVFLAGNSQSLIRRTQFQHERPLGAVMHRDCA